MRNEASSGGQRPGPGRATGRVGKPARSLAQGRLWRSAPLRRPRPRGAGVTARSPGPARPLWRGNSRLCASWARAPCRAAACYKNHPRRGAIPGPLSPAAKEFRKSNLFPDSSRRAPLCSEISLTVETPADIVKAFLAQKKSRLLLGPRPGGSSALAPAAPPGSLDFPAPVGTRHGSSSLNKNH